MHLTMDKEPKDQKTDSHRERKKSLTAAYILASPEKGDEVVLTGMAGRLPDSDDIYHFRDNLYNKVDMVSNDTRRWKPIISEIPQRTGKINFINKFDANFFGIIGKQANKMDPAARILLEKSFEAMLDAGFNPMELKGSKTGVFVGACFSESERFSLYENHQHETFAVIGCARSLMAQRISYYLNLNGPSLTLDTACSSSLFALEQAYKCIRSGECDAALIAGTNLCLNPLVSLQFARLGVLSTDGCCKSFDNSANGYARSEGVCVIFLQKAKDARRVYAEVVHCKTNSDGFKENSITYPSGDIQKVLLDEFYEECKVDPNTVHYVEAHGTGTKVGDPEELRTIEDVFCQNRKSPLLIGAVKSNIGHNEPASGISSIIKVLLGMEHGYIPPNMYYKDPREGVNGLSNGSLQVVSEKTKWPESSEILAAINSFGFGGANCHTLLKWNTKTKQIKPANDGAQLVCVSGRTVEAVKCLLESIEKENMDVEYIRLLQQIYSVDILNHPFRGSAVINENRLLETSFKRHNEENKPLYIMCGGVEKSWCKIGKGLLKNQQFKKFITKCQNVNKHKDINILELILNYDINDFVHQYVSTVVIQMGLMEILKQCCLEPNVILAYSLGELTVAYFEGILKLEQVITIAYHAAKTLKANSYDENQLLSLIKKVIPAEVKLGHRWIPASNNGKSTINAKYLAKALMNKTMSIANNLVPSKASLLKIGVLTDIRDDDFYEVIDLVPKSKQCLVGIYESLGRLYLSNHNVKLQGLGPDVSYPVSRGTGSISPYIRWNHEEDRFIMVYQSECKSKGISRTVGISLRDEQWAYIAGHVVDGKILFPATGYLTLIMDGLAMMIEKFLFDIKVIFTNVRFIRATTITAKSHLVLSLSIQRSSGLFEICEGGIVVVTGRIQELDESDNELNTLSVPFHNDEEVLTQKDIYKELRLRGYNYKGEFRALQEVNISANRGLINWTGNWVTFIDNMLQMAILKQDTRFLYVPTSIDQLIIDAKPHLKYAAQLGETPLLPVYQNDAMKLISSGFIEIRGLTARSIPRRKQPAPILETYKFIPNVAALNLDQSIGVNVHLALENHAITNPQLVEILGTAEEPLMPIIQKVLNNLPVIRAELTLLTNRKFEFDGITTEDKRLPTENEYFMVIGVKLLEDSEVREKLLKCLKPNGFILSRESSSGELCEINSNFRIICDHFTETERLKKKKKNAETAKSVVINVENLDNTFSWIEHLQNTMKTNSNVILFAQGSSENGILGLVNCLRREPSGDKIRCVFLMDENMPPFDQNIPFYKQQLDKGLVINVFYGSLWGTYRHLPLLENSFVKTDHCYVNTLVRGDLSSLNWVEGRLKADMELESGKTLIHIYNAAINFRDIMTASGRISVDNITRNRLEQECVQGFEFSGRDNKGNRWMGMARNGTMASLAAAEAILLFPVPDEWSLEEAATVPVVYGTVLYGFFMRADLRAGQSVLIHSGTGGVGQAAINIALHYGCTVFTTVGTEEKRAFLTHHYPQIRPEHIGCSRDTSFEQMVLLRTNGRGVDLVLNSLAQEKMQASLRCLARGGSFVEIGKFDLVSNNPLRMELFEREITFYGFMLDAMFDMDYIAKAKMSALITNGLKEGFVRPLPRTCFRKEEVEDAFRFMTSGKHIGKVMIRIREEETDRKSLPQLEKFDALPRFYCDPQKSYVIIGGLGGFGLELGDLLVLKGARNLLLTTRAEVKTGYQAMRIRIWRSYGVHIKILKNDATTKQKCENIVKETEELGPVGGIFNLAVVLKDALFDNQTVDNYRESFAAKVDTTKYLDEATRKLCHQLDCFVVFSSVSCGRGNAGQTNYGMANSVMERICEQRVRDGLPGLAIQWGAIGDVGLVAELQQESIDMVIGGTLQQRIASCLEVLDRFLRQPNPVVSSMVVAEKRLGGGKFNNIVDATMQIMGFKDLKTVSLYSTLPELGLDSMMAVEIKQTLEREFEVYLTPQDIRTMTFARLKEIAAEKLNSENGPTEPPVNLQLLFSQIAPQSLSKLVSINLKNMPEEQTVMLLPGIEGNSLMYHNLAEHINANIVCFQYCVNVEESTIKKIAENLYTEALKLVKERGNFNMIAHSFGSLVALELTSMLEKDGYHGNLVIIDGGVEIMKKLLTAHLQTDDENLFQIGLIGSLMATFGLSELFTHLQPDLMKCGSLLERIRFAHSKSPVDLEYSLEYMESLCISAYNRIKAVTNYESLVHEDSMKIQSKVWLYRPTISSVTDVSEDYLLSKCCEKVTVTFLDGNHLTILDNQSLIQNIRDVFDLKTNHKSMKNDDVDTESKCTITKFVIGPNK